MPRNSATKNQMVRGDDVTPVASAARTATGNSGWLSAEDFKTMALLLNVTAASGTTPNLVVSIEEASDASGTNGRSVGAFTAKTTTGSERKSFVIADTFYRIVWTITGTTPSFTFTVAGVTK